MRSCWRVVWELVNIRSSQSARKTSNFVEISLLVGCGLGVGRCSPFVVGKLCFNTSFTKRINPGQRGVITL